MSSKMKKIAPILLTVTASAGVIGTAVLAAKGTPKAIEAKKSAEKVKGKPLTTWETIKAMAPSYIPAAGSGAVTIASIAGMAILNHRQHAELTGIIAGSHHIINQASKKYAILRDRVKEKNPEIVKEIDDKTLDDEWQGYVKERAKKKAWCWCDCFPDVSGEEWGVLRMFCVEYGNGLADENGHELIFFEATPGDVITAFYNLNGLYHQDGLKYVNDLFKLLNLPKTELGNKLVWDPSVLWNEWETDWIGFYTTDMQMEDGVPVPATCTMISFTIPPLAEGYAEGMEMQSRIGPTE